MATVEAGTVVPIIDISAFLAGEDPTETVDELRRACEDVGFFQVVGHQVSDEALAAVEQHMRELAELPLAELQALASPTGHPFRGVEIRYGEHGDDQGAELAVVRLQVNRFDNAEQAEAAGVSPDVSNYFVPNVWPTQVVGLQTAFESLFDQTRAFGRQLMQLMALALRLPRDHFDPQLELDASTLSANYYPPQQVLSTPDNPKVTLQAHTDSGVVTLLHQTGDYTGLQLQGADGSWIDVPVVKGAFIINLGDLISRWTNDRWKSTTHRVIAAQESGRSRLSIPTFYLPALDTQIVAFEAFVGDEGPNYEPTTPYDWESVYLGKYYAQERFAEVVRGR